MTLSANDSLKKTPPLMLARFCQEMSRLMLMMINFHVISGNVSYLRHAGCT